MKPKLNNLPTNNPHHTTATQVVSGFKSLVAFCAFFMPKTAVLVAVVMLFSVSCNSGANTDEVATGAIIETAPPGITETTTAATTGYGAESGKTKPTPRSYDETTDDEEISAPKTTRRPDNTPSTTRQQETEPVQRTTTYVNTPATTNTYSEPRTTAVNPPPPSAGFNTPTTSSASNPNLSNTPPAPTTSVVMPPPPKTTSPPVAEKPKTPEPAGVFVSVNEKNQLKRDLENAFENAEGKEFKSFNLQNRFANVKDEKCINGSFLDNFDKSYSLYTYFSRVRQEPYDLVVEDLVFNEEGKIVQVKVREKAKISKEEN